MEGLLIVGSAVGGGALGFFAGFALGAREGGDFNIAPVIYAPVGAVIGGFVGLVAGVVRWT